jgi:hypothetical protein
LSLAFVFTTTKDDFTPMPHSSSTIRRATCNCSGIRRNTSSRCCQLFLSRWVYVAWTAIVYVLWSGISKCNCFLFKAPAPSQPQTFPMVLHVSVSSLTGSVALSARRFPGRKFFVGGPGLKLQSRLKQAIELLESPETICPCRGISSEASNKSSICSSFTQFLFANFSFLTPLHKSWLVSVIDDIVIEGGCLCEEILGGVCQCFVWTYHMGNCIALELFM